MREIERLAADGHPVERDRRGFHWVRTLEASRSTQLYRTLLHEIGYEVDSRISTDPLNSAGVELDEGGLFDRYWAKPHVEKEAFAHRYAEEMLLRLRNEGTVPFERIIDVAGWTAAGLRPAWFGL